MQFDAAPILNASLAIKVHLATVLPAFALGAYLLVFSKKGAPHHRVIGYIYLALMTITAIAAIFVHEVNSEGFLGLSPIHLFVPLTFWSVHQAIDGARNHRLNQHRGAMIGLFFGGLIIAGALTFLPGRVMHAVFIG